jgi:hypothetical protein
MRRQAGGFVFPGNRMSAATQCTQDFPRSLELESAQTEVRCLHNGVHHNGVCISELVVGAASGRASGELTGCAFCWCVGSVQFGNTSPEALVTGN